MEIDPTTIYGIDDHCDTLLRLVDEFDTHLQDSFLNKADWLNKVLRANGSLGALPVQNGEFV